ncbi:MAG TPA: adenylate/guanylate cyclase domain-containing protein [Solirubrobacteraceae bacterium]|nr:adenylate/guanylate cyclase domain-containing protein [Solirubrobacteraceae bacterium]
MSDQQTYPLPDDPALADVAASLEGAGHWGWVVDPRWRIVYVTDELRLTFGGNVELASWPIGTHMFSPEFLAATRQWRFGTTTDDLFRSNFAAVGGWALTDTPGGRDELRAIVDPIVHDMVDQIEPHDEAAHWFAGAGTGLVDAVGVHVFGFRIRDRDGRLLGTAMITKPAAGMATLGAMTSMGDPRHYERMLQVAKAGRRPAAILFADLEASSPLARRLSTASYFALGRRLVRASDAAVIDAGGMPGRHVGDGTVAFFLTETCGSESAAARACVSAARALRASLDGVADRSGLEPEDVTLRFGLHWGSTLYVGSITTGGRSEVTALGDEVNEAARIEACATGGRMLASKDLMERLEPGDAAALGLDPDRITYTALGELDSATEKARRDAPAIAVCEV